MQTLICFIKFVLLKSGYAEKEGALPVRTHCKYT